LLAEAKQRRTETLGGIIAHRVTIKCQCQDFVQNRFGFCPKGTANPEESLKQYFPSSTIFLVPLPEYLLIYNNL